MNEQAAHGVKAVVFEPHALIARLAALGGRMRLISAIHDPSAITAILAAVDSDEWSCQNTGPPDEHPHRVRAAG